MTRILVGHPLVKVGYATLCAMAGRQELTFDLQQHELDQAADYIEDKYCRPGPWRNFLAGVVFPNSGFVQPSYDKPHLRHKKQEYAELVLRRYRPGTPVIRDRRCACCGREAVFIATREHIPLLNAKGYGNFGGLGQAGLPVCGTCLLAAHALPLGCRIVEGRLLAIYSWDDIITLKFARLALEQTQALLQMESLGKIPGKRFARTRFIEALMDAQQRGAGLSSRYGTSFSLTGYFFTNSGQNADVDILELPSNVVDFLIALNGEEAEVQRAWNAAVTNGWPQHKDRRKADNAGDKGNYRNKLYEDLFDLPYTAVTFLRSHILPTKSWALIALFWRKVIDMEQRRLQAIQELGDRIAEYIQTHADGKKLYKGIHYARYFGDLRLALHRASEKAAEDKDSKPLLPFDLFQRAFLEEDDTADLDWRLARDLLLIRIVERLHLGGWFARNPDAVEETELDHILDERSD